MACSCAAASSGWISQLRAEVRGRRRAKTVQKTEGPAPNALALQLAGQPPQIAGDGGTDVRDDRRTICPSFSSPKYEENVGRVEQDVSEDLIHAEVLAHSSLRRPARRHQHAEEGGEGAAVGG